MCEEIRNRLSLSTTDHTPTVWGVCERLLGEVPDNESDISSMVPFGNTWSEVTLAAALAGQEGPLLSWKHKGKLTWTQQVNEKPLVLHVIHMCSLDLIKRALDDAHFLDSNEAMIQALSEAGVSEREDVAQYLLQQVERHKLVEFLLRLPRRHFVILSSFVEQVGTDGDGSIGTSALLHLHASIKAHRSLSPPPPLTPLLPISTHIFTLRSSITLLNKSFPGASMLVDFLLEEKGDGGGEGGLGEDDEVSESVSYECFFVCLKDLLQEGGSIEVSGVLRSLGPRELEREEIVDSLLQAGLLEALLDIEHHTDAALQECMSALRVLSCNPKLCTQIARLIHDAGPKIRALWQHVPSSPAEVEFQDRLGTHWDEKGGILQAAEEGVVGVIWWLLTDETTKGKLGETVVHVAAKRGDVGCIQMLEQRRFPMDVAAMDGSIPLHWAAESGQLDACMHLVQNGSNIISCRDDNWSPIHCAGAKGHVEVCRWFLEESLPHTLIHSEKSDPVTHIAAKHNQVEVLRLLINARKGFDLQLRTKSGETALHVAAREGALEAATFLLNAGSNPNEEDEERVTPLHIAKTDDMAILLLQEGASVAAKDSEGKTPLHMAAMNGRARVACTLLNNNVECADPNETDAIDATPLHHAAAKDQVEVCAVLHRRGANLRLKTTKGSTPLHEAAAAGHEAVCRFLLDKERDTGMDVDEKGWTAIHFAVSRMKSKLYPIFQEFGLNLEAKTFSGLTPLQMAVRHSKDTKLQLESCEALLKCSVNPNTVGNRGTTALHIAAEKEDSAAVCKLLCEYEADVTSAVCFMTPLLYSVWKENAEGCRVLLEYKSDVEASDSNGQTSLHYVAKNGNHDVCMHLLNAGASVHAIDSKHYTPLHLAIAAANTDVCVALLNAGAPYEARDYSDRTPWDLAKERSNKKVLHLIEYLEESRTSSGGGGE